LGARRKKRNRGRERACARGREGDSGRGGLIPSQGGGAHPLTGIDGGQLATEQLAERRKTTGRLDGLALVGFGWERRGGEMGHKRPSWFRNPFFFQGTFSDFVFKAFCTALNCI
jgi:hypothetical protein